MAQGSHVPKFGNWDGGNVPYTAYFENARKDKAGGAKMINPNDPEENPEAFMFARAPDKPMSAGKSRMERHKQRNGDRRNTSYSQKSASQKSLTSESGSERSNSDYSVPRHTKSDRKESINGRANSFDPPSRPPNGQRTGSNALDDVSYRSASIPKFGAWNENDPESGVGFTVIFNKVKEEKHIAAAKMAVPPHSTNYSGSHTNETGSKMYCCMFPRTRE